MSDLSRLLEDVYRSDSPAPAPTPAPGPSWASDAALDEVFADWVPGPPDDAPEAERAYSTPGQDDGSDGAQQADADPFAPLQALLEEAMRLAPDIEEPDDGLDEPEATAAGDAALDPPAAWAADVDASRNDATPRQTDATAFETAAFETAADATTTAEAFADLDVTTAPIELDAPATALIDDMLDPAVDDLLDPVVHVARDDAFVPPAPVSGWTRADDDILPRGRARRGFRLRR